MVCCGNPDARCCGHPNGAIIWLPMICTLAGLILTAANYGCNLATFSNGQTVQIRGTICTLPEGSFEFQCDTRDLSSSKIGLWSFLDDNTQQCVPYFTQEWWTSPWIISSSVFSGLRWLFGIISFFWLAFAMCCPIRSSHKCVLLALTFFAAVFQGLFFLFYGNELCQEYGCDLAEGSSLAIAGACVFFVAFMFVACIKPLTPSWEEEQGRDEYDDHQIQQKPTVDSGDGEQATKQAVTGVVLQEEHAPQV